MTYTTWRFCHVGLKIGCPRCVKYIDKQPTQHQPLCGGQCSIQNFEKGRSEKKIVPVVT